MLSYIAVVGLAYIASLCMYIYVKHILCSDEELPDYAGRSGDESLHTLGAAYA